MPSPVELTQLKIQYQRNVGTPRASNRIELGATEPAPGSTSNASTFLSLTRERLGSTATASRESRHGSGDRSLRAPWHDRCGLSERDALSAFPTICRLARIHEPVRGYLDGDALPGPSACSSRLGWERPAAWSA